jgi:hypothetical protein|tara:strand:+ start:3564 stop:3809 length:246 start_codon:yes stop_codon:yes gene_type:complete
MMFLKMIRKDEKARKIFEEIFWRKTKRERGLIWQRQKRKLLFVIGSTKKISIDRFFVNFCFRLALNSASRNGLIERETITH